MKFRLTILMLLSGLLFLWGQEGVSQQLPTEKAEIYALDPQTLWNITMLVRICHRETDALLGTRELPKRTLDFYALERSFSESEFRGNSVALPKSENAQRGIWRVFRAMVLRRLRELVADKRFAEPHAVSVVAAGLANRVVYCGAVRGFYAPDFSVPREQFRQRNYPSLETLLNMPAPSDQQAIFHLYMLHSNLLLDILEGTTRDFPGLLTAWSRYEIQEGLSPAEALRKALPPGSVGENESMQAWYERNALSVANARVRNNSPEEIREKLEEQMTISVLSADAQDGIRRVHLEQVPQMLKDYKLDDSALAALQNNLVKLVLASPPLLQESIGMYVSAVDAFRQHDMRFFRERLQAGRASLDTAITRQTTAERLLDEAEENTANQRRFQEWLEMLELREALKPLDQAVGL